MLSYRRKIALQGALVLAKSGRLEQYNIFRDCDKFEVLNFVKYIKVANVNFKES